jgi:putative membrane protein
MRKDPAYHRFDDEELILRDYLATDRTVLANERTLLAYLRTALGGFVAGVSFIQFFSTVVIHVLGWVFCIGAIVAVSIGMARYRQVERSLRHLRVGGARGLGQDTGGDDSRASESE